MWVPGSYEFLENPLAFLSFALQIVPKSLCSCLRLFIAITKLHLKNEKVFNESKKCIVYVIKAYYFMIYVLSMYNSLPPKYAT